jgi:hypothetical protein
LKLAQANSLGDPVLKNPSQKRAGGVGQGIGPEFKLQYHQKKKDNSGIYLLGLFRILNSSDNTHQGIYKRKMVHMPVLTSIVAEFLVPCTQILNLLSEWATHSVFY